MLVLTLNFKVNFFYLHRILFITGTKLIKRTMGYNSAVLLKNDVKVVLTLILTVFTMFTFRPFGSLFYLQFVNRKN